MIGDVDSSVLVALVAATGGVITTWLTVKYKHLVTGKSDEQKPMSRMDTIYDGYEKLILQQQAEIERKSGLVDHLEKIVAALEKELEETKRLLTETKSELIESNANNERMRKQLKTMRQDYESI